MQIQLASSSAHPQTHWAARNHEESARFLPRADSSDQHDQVSFTPDPQRMSAAAYAYQQLRATTPPGSAPPPRLNKPQNGSSLDAATPQESLSKLESEHRNLSDWYQANGQKSRAKLHRLIAEIADGAISAELPLSFAEFGLLEHRNHLDQLINPGRPNIREISCGPVILEQTAYAFVKKNVALTTGSTWAAFVQHGGINEYTKAYKAAVFKAGQAYRGATGIAELPRQRSESMAFENSYLKAAKRAAVQMPSMAQVNANLEARLSTRELSVRPVVSTQHELRTSDILNAQRPGTLQDRMLDLSAVYFGQSQIARQSGNYRAANVHRAIGSILEGALGMKFTDGETRTVSYDNPRFDRSSETPFSPKAYPVSSQLRFLEKAIVGTLRRKPELIDFTSIHTPQASFKEFVAQGGQADYDSLTKSHEAQLDILGLRGAVPAAIGSGTASIVGGYLTLLRVFAGSHPWAIGVSILPGGYAHFMAGGLGFLGGDALARKLTTETLSKPVALNDLIANHDAAHHALDALV